MKLEILEEHRNYVCTVVKLPAKQPVPGLDKLVKVTVFGNDVLTQKDTDENQLYLFFPCECQIDYTYLASNNEYRNATRNDDPTQKGFFEDNSRCKAIKFKGVISTGYLAPVSTLDYLRGVDGMGKFDYKLLKPGDEFNSIDGVLICKKYKPVHQHSQTPKESRFNKKLKRFSKLIANQFRFHISTAHLAKNLHMFQPEDIIVITDKWHGTSGVFSNVLTKKQLNWKEKLVKWLGFNLVETEYDNLYSSRTVVKNEYINPEQQGGYYNEDIWKIVNKELEGKIEQGITLYGEIVGFLPSGKHIQKGYDYGCDLPVTNVTPKSSHKFLCYRVTYTKPDGNVIEFSWQQIKDYCKKHSIETVKELYSGRLDDFKYRSLGLNILDLDNTVFLEKLQLKYLEKDCVHCTNKVPAEGVVVRLDGRETFSAFKLKAKRFLELETKQLDAGEVSIEDEQSVDVNYEEQL